MEIADTPESTLMMQRAFMRCMIECDSRIERQKAGLVLQDIIPVTLEEAKRWCEMYISPDYYEEVFGPVEE